ncbi:hypothetical protein G5I_06686 [Acromyrmex echinatior]|uniref:Uncharacterized protein n=1 Tax=Acromyrmex echinatior TaxID=103372 RepID=F4WLR0_ACREC|nr:hypothetical protein G5I_06686 [Acromyrmex echinatior]
MSDRLNLAGHVHVGWSARPYEYGISRQRVEAGLPYKMRPIHFIIILSLSPNRIRDAPKERWESASPLTTVIIHEENKCSAIKDLAVRATADM